ncbi:MAG: tRNA uridine-5-carboxymethylaminomethyl(34) synthesis enzyme MnmG [bacterium]|jgi:tRNA uridine 5-carboxymethylaminomethyl modification enzyme
MRIRPGYSNYDVIVVGAGHAGCEAALAAARMGCRTLLTTLSLEHIALMPCNPSVGGPAKGHLVREIDALGGEMANNTDKAYVQIRVLNISKGPAVRALRAVCDKSLYRRRLWQTLGATANLVVREAAVTELLTGADGVVGVRTQTGAVYNAPAVVLTTGVYLRSEVFVGELKFSGGPQGQPAAQELTRSLLKRGFETGRFRTTSPPRISGRSVDYSQLKEQRGSKLPLSFSVWNQPRRRRQLSCWLTYTTERTHEIIRTNLQRSPFSVDVLPDAEPRYCPSIEGKVKHFPDRPAHQVFLEPEGWNTDEVYLTGLFTSLPEEVQVAVLHSIPGLEQAQMLRPGYGIEYDYLPATQLTASLESKIVRGLFCAGQVNGTSGYEEAAAQGIMAGINAARYVQGQPPLVLGRGEAYIGVLIDDLVTKGPREPYRMLTSRAEHRLLLRSDNADLRLAPHGYQVGLLPAEKYERFQAKRAWIQREITRLEQEQLTPSADINAALKELGSAPLTHPISLAALLRRPELCYSDISRLAPPLEGLSGAAADTVEAEIKYAAYIEKEKRLVEQMRELEEKVLPSQLDYGQIKALSREAQEKLALIRPRTLGQAGRIPGVSPADVAVLMVYLRGGGRSRDG